MSVSAQVRPDPKSRPRDSVAVSAERALQDKLPLVIYHGADAGDAKETRANQQNKASFRPVVHEPKHELLDGPITPLRELRPSNPRRPPHTRWDLTRQVLLGKKGLQRYLDHDASQALILQRAIARCGTDEHLLAISQECAAPWPAMLEAVFVWKQGGSFRDLIEARLLSGECCEQIAVKTGATSELIRWYSSLFFDVADKLNAPDYITTVLIGNGLHDLSLDDNRTLWRAYGYWGGGDVLDMVVHGHSRDPDGRVGKFFREDFRQQLALKAAVAIRSLDLTDPKIALRVAKLWQRWQEVELRRQQVDQYEMKISHNLDVCGRDVEMALERTEPALQRCFGHLFGPPSRASSPDMPGTGAPDCPFDAELDPLAI